MAMQTCTAIIVAAGDSARMGGRKSKQLVPLLGVPAIVRTLLAFEHASRCGGVVLVCRKADAERLRELAREHKVTKLLAVVPGGATRQQSVAAGMEAVADCDFLAIHDGARPLVTPEEIDRVIADAAVHGASALAVPVKDTIKVADKNGFVEHTPCRDSLWAVQTPQVFACGAYRAALTAAWEDYTDDCQVFEQQGLPVHLCPGSAKNLKLTTAEDIGAAETILRQREAAL